MITNLFEIYSNRPNRFNLINKGLKIINSFSGKNVKSLEIGCGLGDASAYLAKEYNFNVIALDYSEETIAKAKKRHQKLVDINRLDFFVCDFNKMCFNDNEFDFVFCEAAFSPSENKEETAKECYRVLKNGGYLLINDFCINYIDEYNDRKQVDYIPCFAGVSTIDKYTSIFHKAGFELISAKEECGEFIGIVMWVSKSLGVNINEIGPYLSGYYNFNAQSECTMDCYNNNFFKKSKLSFCQLLLKK